MIALATVLAVAGAGFVAAWRWLPWESWSVDSRGKDGVL